MQLSIFVFTDDTCTWFILSSTQGIANEYPSSLGIYKKINCHDTSKILYLNEQNGFFLQQLNISTKSWVVRIESFMMMYSYVLFGLIIPPPQLFSTFDIGCKYVGCWVHTSQVQRMYGWFFLKLHVWRRLGVSQEQQFWDWQNS